jgi:hypothetical protein
LISPSLAEVLCKRLRRSLSVQLSVRLPKGPSLESIVIYRG